MKFSIIFPSSIANIQKLLYQGVLSIERNKDNSFFSRYIDRKSKHNDAMHQRIA